MLVLVLARRMLVLRQVLIYAEYDSVVVVDTTRRTSVVVVISVDDVSAVATNYGVGA